MNGLPLGVKVLGEGAQVGQRSGDIKTPSSHGNFPFLHFVCKVLLECFFLQTSFKRLSLQSADNRLEAETRTTMTFYAGIAPLRGRERDRLESQPTEYDQRNLEIMQEILNQEYL